MSRNSKKSTAPLAKPVKVKLVRDSFTMPRDDHALIDALKDRALGFKRPTKKSELLRAGLQVLSQLPAAALQDALNALTPIKAGRPKADTPVDAKASSARTATAKPMTPFPPEPKAKTKLKARPKAQPNAKPKVEAKALSPKATQAAGASKKASAPATTPRATKRSVARPASPVAPGKKPSVSSRPAAPKPSAARKPAPVPVKASAFPAPTKTVAARTAKKRAAPSTPEASPATSPAAPASGNSSAAA